MPDKDSEISDTVIDAQAQGLSGWRTALQNYRELLELDNTLIWLINVITMAFGYGIIAKVDGFAGIAIGGLVVVMGLLGMLDSLYGRVSS